MAIVHNVIDGLTKQMYEMSAKESELSDQLSTVAEARKALSNQLRDALHNEQRSIEQTLLRLDFEAGDRTVKRDPDAGNGGGAFYREGAASSAQMDQLLGQDYSSFRQAVMAFQQKTGTAPTQVEQEMLMSRVRREI